LRSTNEDPNFFLAEDPPKEADMGRHLCLEIFSSKTIQSKRYFLKNITLDVLNGWLNRPTFISPISLHSSMEIPSPMARYIQKKSPLTTANQIK
jgi:hypothetical protein